MTSYGFSDSQVHSERHLPHFQGSVPDTMFPHRYWLTGESVKQRPMSAPPGTFYVIEGSANQVWVWLHPLYQLGLMAERPSIGRPGLVWKAIDTGQVFVWED